MPHKNRKPIQRQRMANRVPLRNLYFFFLGRSWISSPKFLNKWTEKKKNQIPLKGGYFIRGVAHSLSYYITNKLTFTLKSMLAHIWILSCTKPRTHHGWQILGSSDPGTLSPTLSPTLPWFTPFQPPWLYFNSLYSSPLPTRSPSHAATSVCTLFSLHFPSLTHFKPSYYYSR